MTFRIDRVVGAEAAAELINRYRAELREQDLLPDSVALAIACEAYADGYVYVLARAGQVWARRGDSPCEPTHLRIVTVSRHSSYSGYTALCLEPMGLFHVLPLNELDEHFVLTQWPAIAWV
ncbi:hypothetical protein ACFCXT_30450 [Streptomyces vinaceus]|uniref:hypothetical protein n=1 Tax=Streptomyces vinaceus TaxID=1960 RepID=UPI0035D60FF8